MVDIIIAGAPEEDFQALEKILRDGKEGFERLDVDLTDPRFIEATEEIFPSLVIARFHEGDLASIKAMQTYHLKKPFTQFIFITGKDISQPILTLMFNEGAFGILSEPLNESSALLLVRQAVKKARWELEENARTKELSHINSNLMKRVDNLEINNTRQRELIRKLEAMLAQALSDKTFKTSRVRILLVSTSEYQRSLVSSELASAGFNVESCKDGASAMESFKSFKPSIIVADLELDDMTGVELSAEVKKISASKKAYFVVITSTKEKIGGVLAASGTVDDCVLKPAGSENHYTLLARIALGALRL